jgi:selenide,water dikinase
VFSLVDVSTPHPDLLVGTNTFDDAGVFRLSPDTALVQIAASNALSDVYAMGGRPLTVLNIVGYPISKLPPAMLAEILRGGTDKVKEAGAVIVGGHSIDDPEPKYGLAVTGICHPDRVWTNTGAKPGDALVLTKPLGAGVITTAIKRGYTTEADVEEITRVMAALNNVAAEVGQRYSVHACTDVTGFGLLGHGWEMAHGSNVAIRIRASQVPILPRAYDFAEMGAVPGGTKKNLAHVAEHVTFASHISEIQQILLADSITSGGLLMSLPPAEAETFVQELASRGVTAAIIGEVAEGQPYIFVD